MTDQGRSQFKRWLTAPPRPHGAILEDRTVSNLELFYDLVYVAVITQVANRLSSDISLRGFAEFAVVFAMLWIAWINGSLYIELHGREDGRTRLLVFLQMGILALLAVFGQHAADSTGTQFARRRSAPARSWPAAVIGRNSGRSVLSSWRTDHQCHDMSARKAP